MAPTTRPPLDTRPTWQKVRIVQHKAILTLKDFVNEPVNYDAELVSLWRKYSVGGIYENEPRRIRLLKKLSEDGIEIKAMFKRFTTDKEQHWKDEQARRRRTALVMTDFDYKKIVRESVEQDAETKEIKEDHLKHIEEISKHLSEPKSVLEVKRVHEGEVTVLGTIVSASEMYVLEEVDSGSITYKDAKSIQLEDTERPDENERLDVVLYDHMISNVLAGEVVEITGINRIESKRGSKSKKKTTVLHAESIKYLNRKELVITDDDITNFQKFAKLPNLLERLVSMYAPNIIGHNYAKLGVLRSVVGGVEHGKIRGRINTFMVGDPSTAKSTLAREAVDVKPNSRYVSRPHSSAKTITAIMDKENDGLVLRLGAIHLSRGGICGVNEITEFQLDDQARLLDVLEEGIIPLNKHGTHMIIQSPTTIIATANPTQSTWNDSQKVSNDEIPMLELC